MKSIRLRSQTLRWLVFGLISLSVVSPAFPFGISPNPLGPKTITFEKQDAAGQSWDIPPFGGPTPVEFDATKGPWEKTLQNPQGMNLAAVNPGTRFRVAESLVVDGTTSWADWHELILTPGWRWVVPPIDTPNFMMDGLVPQPVPGLAFTSTGLGAGIGGSLDFTFDPLAPGTKIIIDKELLFDGQTPFTGTVTIQEFPTIVPEPSTLLLLGSSLAGLGGVARRRHRRK